MGAVESKMKATEDNLAKTELSAPQLRQAADELTEIQHMI